MQPHPVGTRLRARPNTWAGSPARECVLTPEEVRPLSQPMCRLIAYFERARRTNKPESMKSINQTGSSTPPASWAAGAIAFQVLRCLAGALMHTSPSRGPSGHLLQIRQFAQRKERSIKGYAPRGGSHVSKHQSYTTRPAIPPPYFLAVVKISNPSSRFPETSSQGLDRHEHAQHGREQVLTSQHGQGHGQGRATGTDL